MPTLAEEVGHPIDSPAAVVAGLRLLYARGAAKNEAMYRTGEPYPAEMKRWARTIGVGFVIVGLGFGAAAVLSMMVSLADGKLYVIQVLLLVLAPALVIAGLYQILTGRSAIRK
jgi:hypothetical protein